MSTYEFVEPFDIDDGQLDYLTPAKAFTLGVEWEMVRAETQAGADVERTVHTDNRSRIAALLSRHGYHQRWQEGDDWSSVTASQDRAALAETPGEPR